MRQHEFAQIRVQRETGSAVTDSQHQHGGWAVQGVTGSHLLTARLQKIFFCHIPTAVYDVLRRTQNRKNTADRHVHINVG